MGGLFNQFWLEFDDFQAKNKGDFEHREYYFILNHPGLINHSVSIWHKKETYHSTEIFGDFACRVCSKVLGIGSAERSWGNGGM